MFAQTSFDNNRPVMMVIVDGEEQKRLVDHYDMEKRVHVPVLFDNEIIRWAVGDVRPHIDKLFKVQ